MQNTSFAKTGRALLAWYSLHARDLPWRRTGDPYAIWVAEVMLQQTRVETVVPYYERFLARFPDPPALAAAREEEVLKHWEGLGYYRRARHLHRAVREVVQRYGGEVPSDIGALRRLPGVGEYTAAAIASIAHGAPHAAVDGNILRVVTRIAGLRRRIDRPDVRRRVAEIVVSMIPDDGAGQLNQALMDLGSGVCLPRSPRCGECPIARWCIARNEGLTDRIPAVPRKSPPRPEPCAFAVLRRNGRVALARRPEGGLLGGLTAFPGVEGSDGPDALARHLAEAHGLDVRLARVPVLSFSHAFSHVRWTAMVYECEPARPRARGRGLAWLRPADLARRAIPAAHRKIVRYVQGEESA